MKTLLIFTAVCLAVAYSQVLVPCTTPDQWEARMSRIDPRKRYSVRAKISYDATNRRVRVVEEVDLKEDREFFDVIFLHNTEPGTEYRVNLKSKECAKKSLTEAWRPVGIPPNATFLGEEYIGTGGLPGAGVLTSLWEHTFADGDKYFGVFTVEGCIPIQEERYSNRTGLETATFFNVTGGISDPSVFTPPKECN